MAVDRDGLGLVAFKGETGEPQKTDFDRFLERYGEMLESGRIEDPPAFEVPL